MAILYPGTLDTLTNPSGTQYLDSPSHSTQHSDLNDAIEALESKVGVGSGTPTVNKVMVGSGNGTATWSGTWNSATLGTPAITGGTVANSLVGTSTITGGTLSGAMLIGTVQHTGGTVTGAQLGTNTITGGTATSTVLNSNTVGTPTITGGSWTTGTISTSVLGTPTITGGTLSSSTINNAVISTASITGGSVNSINLGTPTITVGSDATGDLFYRSSTGTIARLGIGTSTQVLTSNGTIPSWGAASSGVTSVVTGSNLTGGTITGAGTVAMAGTISPTMIGTTTILGGTINTVTLGTPTTTGGTYTSGTFNSATIGTPTVTGGNINVVTLGSPTITLGSDATGDIFYRNAGGSVARLAVGTPNQIIKVSAGTLPSWGDNTADGVTSITTGTNLSGGTITSIGTISLAGTIQPTMIGTTTILGGTINTVTMGTPTVTGGTFTTPVVSQFGTASGLGASWGTWTPSWTNLTVGNGTLNYARYIALGKTNNFVLSFTLGTSSAITNNVSVSIPTTSVAYSNFFPIAYGCAIDETGSVWSIGLFMTSGSVGRLFVDNGSFYASLNGSTPFTWTSGDSIYLTGMYEGL